MLRLVIGNLEKNIIANLVNNLVICLVIVDLKRLLGIGWYL